MNILEKLKLRKMSQEDKVLTILRKKGKYGATQDDFISFRILRYGDCIMRLRRQGYAIDSVRIKGSLWKYYLDGNK